MKTYRPLIALLLLFALIAVAAGSSKHRHSNHASQGTPGVFDYYLLTLSWSPEFCYSHPQKPECQSGHHGFVVHGLWPQYVQGYPENCSTAAGLANPAAMEDIMPDAGLVAHEWTTHGTCSGLDAEAYFKLLRRAFQSVKVPERFAAPRENFSIPPQDVKSEFVRDNPKFSADEMTVSCGNNYLTAVSFCVSKDLKPTACQNLRDCRANVIRVPAVK
ncbi:MAG TPA: ribonuclease T2 [Candidatus Sulfotelmatobacter sp.]|nr:ribonuclease T2 [Candidatus Sulfotelmatobacter sp.]